MSNRKYKNRYNTIISFEKDLYDEFRELLAKGVCISDEINAYMKYILGNPEKRIRFSMHFREANR